MIYVDESDPEGDPESQFTHRQVAFKRARDVRTQFVMLNEIGRGKFGKVMKCRHAESGQIFAAKFVMVTSRDDRRNVEREVEIMNALDSPKLLQLYDAYENGTRTEMCLITEYIGGGELFDRVIEDEFVLTERACVCFMKQILEGVSYMHHNQIIHLDLKPENILCLTKSGNRIKIIDFGLARHFEPMKKLQVLFGTPEFVAPEVVGFEPISYATDMWAVGVICYVLLSGLSPFMGDTDLETMANVTIAEYDYDDEAFDNISEEAKDFIDSLLVKEKEKRISADSCLKHPWLQQLNQASPSTIKQQESESPCEAPVSSSLTSAKQNLSTNKDHFHDSHCRDYVFDRPSKTISMAAASPTPTTALIQGGGPAPPTAQPTTMEVEDQEEAELTQAANLLLSPSTDSIRSVSPAHVITLDQIKQKASEIITAASESRENSIRKGSAASSTSTQINEEDLLRLRSLHEDKEQEFGSSEWEWDEGEDCDEDDDDDQGTKVEPDMLSSETPTQKEERDQEVPMAKVASCSTSSDEDCDTQGSHPHPRTKSHSESTGGQATSSSSQEMLMVPAEAASSSTSSSIPSPLLLMPSSRGAPDPASSSVFVTEYPDEPTTPKSLVGTASLNIFDHKAAVREKLPNHLQLSHPSALVSDQLIEGHPLWLAAERTVTPMYELLTSATSEESGDNGSQVSKSNSELSVAHSSQHAPSPSKTPRLDSTCCSSSKESSVDLDRNSFCEKDPCSSVVSFQPPLQPPKSLPLFQTTNNNNKQVPPYLPKSPTSPTASKGFSPPTYKPFQLSSPPPPSSRDDAGAAEVRKFHVQTSPKPFRRNFVAEGAEACHQIFGEIQEIVDNIKAKTTSSVKSTKDDLLPSAAAEVNPVKDSTAQLDSLLAEVDQIKSSLSLDSKDSAMTASTPPSLSSPVGKAPAPYVKPFEQRLSEPIRTHYNAPCREKEEAQRAMAQLEKTILEIKKPDITLKEKRPSFGSLVLNQQQFPGESNADPRKGLFSSAQTGSVNQAKSKFERKTSDANSANYVLQGPRQRSTTPFRSARSPSPGLQPLSSLRRRSPSPVKTGAVNRARSKFESTENLSGIATSSSSGPECASPGAGGGQGSTTQTLPRTFKLGAASRVLPVDRSVVRPWRAGPAAQQNNPPGATLSRHSSFTSSDRSRLQSGPGSRYSNNNNNNNNSVSSSPAHRPGMSTSTSASTSASCSRLLRQESLPASLQPSSAGPKSVPTFAKPTQSSSLKSAQASGATAGFQQPQQRQKSPPESASNGNGQSSGSSSFSATMKSLPSRFMMQDAAQFLSQKLPSLSSSGQVSFQQLKAAAPSIVNTYVKTPFGYS